MNKIYTKIYYRLLKKVLPAKKIELPQELAKKKCLFVYFDYEREFGGHKTSIKDADIYSILDILDKYSIKTTWFTVGRIIAEYPASVKEIISRGHEIGSHTYSHIPPLHLSKKELLHDFEQYREQADGIYDIKGFHSPNGKWSLSLLTYLAHFKYDYDLISASPKEDLTVKYLNKTKLMRFKTIGDDWHAYIKKNSGDEFFDYFKTKYDRIGNGDIAGLGFHPWVLVADKKFLDAFEQFIAYVAVQEDTVIDCVGSFVKLIEKK